MKTIFKQAACVVAACLALLLVGCSMTGGSGQEELRTSSDMTDTQNRASIRLQLAAGYYQQKQWEVALDEIKKALAVEPNNADAYIIRAMIYMEMGEMPLAEDNFKRAMGISPNNPDLANNYGWFLCQTGQEAKAIPYFEAAVKTRNYQTPDKALNNAGVCSLKLKDERAAEDYFNRAFRLDPSNPYTNSNLAKLYYIRGDFNRARFYMARVVKGNNLTADMLWSAIKVERKLGDRSAESALAAQLRNKYPTSKEFSAYQRGAFNE